MKIKSFYITASFACLFMLTSCVDYEVKDPNFMPPDVVLDEGDDDEIIEGLPTPGEMQAYSPSLLGKPYRPIKVKYSSQFPPVASWTEANTRIVAYMGEYKPSIKTESDYKAITNKYGSLTTGAKQQATGRFYVKKVNGRWWIIDPEGYPHYERSVTSGMVLLRVIRKLGTSVLAMIICGYRRRRQNWPLSAFMALVLFVPIHIVKFRRIIKVIPMHL